MMNKILSNYRQHTAYSMVYTNSECRDSEYNLFGYKKVRDAERSIQLLDRDTDVTGGQGDRMLEEWI
jgi:hypothetical protein